MNVMLLIASLAKTLHSCIGIDLVQGLVALELDCDSEYLPKTDQKFLT